MSGPAAATLADLAGMGLLEGRRVRFLADDIPSWVPKGTIGTVTSYSTCEGKACVCFVDERYPEGNCWRNRHLETRFECLELVTG